MLIASQRDFWSGCSLRDGRFLVRRLNFAPLLNSVVPPILGPGYFPFWSRTTSYIAWFRRFAQVPLRHPRVDTESSRASVAWRPLIVISKCQC